jgi:virulence-associated protein VagC
MIEKQVFSQELKALSEWFKHPISDEMKARLYLIFSAELSTDEFKKSVFWAFRSSRFFPAPSEMIESVLGTIEDRAVLQWASCDRLSQVGIKAMALRGNGDAETQKREFIKAYKAYAKESIISNPSELRMPEAVLVIEKSDRELINYPHPSTWTDDQKNNWTKDQWREFTKQKDLQNV